jgi:hypothetical protein
MATELTWRPAPNAGAAAPACDSIVADTYGGRAEHRRKAKASPFSFFYPFFHCPDRRLGNISRCEISVRPSGWVGAACMHEERPRSFLPATATGGDGVERRVRAPAADGATASAFHRVEAGQSSAQLIPWTNRAICRLGFGRFLFASKATGACGDCAALGGMRRGCPIRRQSCRCRTR